MSEPIGGLFVMMLICLVARGLIEIPRVDPGQTCIDRVTYQYVGRAAEGRPQMKFGTRVVCYEN